AQQVVRFHLRVRHLFGLLLHLRGILRAEADLPASNARLDDLLQAVEGSTTDEQYVLGVDLDVFLLRMLAPALRRYRGNSALENLEQRLLHPLARHVPRDARVLGLPRDLVDFVYVDDAALAVGHVEVTGLQQPYEDVLHVFAHVTSLCEGSGVGDGEGNVQDARERLSQKRLAHTGGAEQQDIAL